MRRSRRAAKMMRWSAAVCAAATLVVACGNAEPDRAALFDFFTAEGGWTDDASDCLTDALWGSLGPVNASDLGDAETVSATVRRDRTPTERDVVIDQAMADALDACTPRQLRLDAPLEFEQLPADDPALHALAERCGPGGEAGACDELHLIAPASSDYEQFGRQCGGRGPGMCEEVIARGG